MSSKRHIRQHSCTRKAKYENRETAIKSNYAISMRLKDYGMHVYKCPYCRKWHIGHPQTHPTTGHYERGVLKLD